MDNIYCISKSKKNKHLTFKHYEYIINSLIKHSVLHKDQIRHTGRTNLMKELARDVGTTLSNVYEIVNAAKITVVNSNLIVSEELSAVAAFNLRTKKRKKSNNSKLEKAASFIKLIISELQSNKMSSIDETIHYLSLHKQEKIKGMTTVCTKTFYSYVHKGQVPILPIDLPRMVRLKRKISDKEYIPKRQKGTPISERPFEPSDREIFGHWEGDLVTGPRDGKKGAYLTLIERKTRFFLMIPISRKSSKQVYMKFNILHKYYGDNFKEIFKSITFDNGSEFSRYKDIEIKPGTSEKRTSVYFARPYHSCDRASNENCNGLIRRYIKKGTDIGQISREMTIDINRKINQKKRKILNYLPSEQLFIEELAKLNRHHNTIYYE